MIMECNVKLVMKVCTDKVGDREQCYRYTGKTTTADPAAARDTTPKNKEADRGADDLDVQK